MKVKKILALSLACLMSLSSISASYASSLGGSNAGGNTGSSGTGGAGGAATTSNEKQGYRFTFINNETGERMSKTVDIVRSDPNTVKNIWEIRESIIDKSTPTEYYRATFSALEQRLAYSVLSYNPDTDAMPWWYAESGSNYTGESETFQNWLLSDEARLSLSGGGAGLYGADALFSKRGA